MTSDLSLIDVLYASTVGALILRTPHRRPLPASTLRRIRERGEV